MILSKMSLLTSQIASDDKDIPALSNIHVREDGTTIAASGKSVIAVSPVRADVKKNVILQEAALDASVTIPLETAKEVLKNFPKDTLFGGLLEHCDIAVTDSKALFTLKDGKRTKEVTGNMYTHQYIDFSMIVQEVGTTVRSSAVNIKRFISLLTTIEKMVADSDIPVFIEFTDKNDIVLRAQNPVHGQKVFALMKSYKTETWLEKDDWEKSLSRKKIKKIDIQKCV